MTTPFKEKNISALERTLGLGLGLFLMSKTSQLGKARKLFFRLTGLGLLGRSVTGHSLLYRSQKIKSFRIPLKSSFTLMGTPLDLFKVFTNIEQLNAALKNIRFVPRTTDSQVPSQFQYKWYFGSRDHQLYSGEVRIEIDEANNEIIFWSSPEELIPVEGRLKLSPTHKTSNGEFEGTTLEVSFRYHPPLGLFGILAKPILHKAGQFFLREELRRVKQFVETGEVATIQGQSSGRSKVKARPKTPPKIKHVPMGTSERRSA